MNPANEDETHPQHQLNHSIQKLMKMIGDRQNEKKATLLLRLVVIHYERPTETSQRVKRETTQRKT